MVLSLQASGGHNQKTQGRENPGSRVRGLQTHAPCSDHAAFAMFAAGDLCIEGHVGKAAPLRLFSMLSTEARTVRGTAFSG